MTQPSSPPRNKRLVLALIFLSAVAGLAAWGLVGSVLNSAGSHEEAQLAPSTGTPAAHDAGHLELPKALMEVVHPLADPTPPRAPAEDTSADKPAAVEPIPHVPQDGNPYRLFVSSDYFAQKYATATTQELLVAQAILEAEALEEMADTTAAYLDSGRGQLEVVPRQPEKEELVMPPPQKSYGLIGTCRTRVEGDSLIVLTGQLPWDEYAWLYDKQDEVGWLGGELGRREQAARAIALQPAPSKDK